MTYLSSHADTPSHVIRVITPADLETVRYIDRDAFDTYRRQQQEPNRPLRLRTLENMTAAIQRPSAGVVVEWPRGRVVGYCFTHIWGSLGWLGTLGIAPQNQGLGLGHAVTAAGLSLLREVGCRVLALETMPESGKNLALYTRLGLDARHLTLLCQGTPEAARSTHFELWKGDAALHDVAAALIPGLDPTPAASWLAAEGAGETLVWWENSRPSAFAVLRRTPRRMEGLQTYLTVEAAGCLPDAAREWPRYLSEMQTYARDLGKSGLVLPVSAEQTSLLRSALNAGLRIVHTRVRMVAGEFPSGPDTILMLTLAM